MGEGEEKKYRFQQMYHLEMLTKVDLSNSPGKGNEKCLD